jgi:hypothetical protein
MADDGAPADRVWASQWYRVTPRSFEHIELFFDPDRVIYAFAGESYKSFLLRRDGREQRAQELGAEYRGLEANRILADERHEATLVGQLQGIRLASGSFIRKPKLVLETDEQERSFYHHSKTHDVEPLADQLEALYPSVPVVVDGDRSGKAPTSR